ncbi:hypothetical protein HNV11_04775 [Spirosoma taeanense]|uniref:Uncharacterized protein n=1 Tax=Spirosoma taeanense TaxID=2735870 RepID=A0A6M5Y687_9BACT|nr:hypothetical protein [Spirosoma taeanense]QJW88741.1 hypothetical protein HNV11_04775 [Spirosoma taeanense]
MKTIKLILLGLAGFAIPLLFFFQSKKISDLKKQDAQAKADSALRLSIADSVKKELDFRFNLKQNRDSFNLRLALAQVAFKQDVIDLYRNQQGRTVNIRADVSIPTPKGPVSETNVPGSRDLIDRLEKLQTTQNLMANDLQRLQGGVQSLSAVISRLPPNPPRQNKVDSITAEINRLNNIRDATKDRRVRRRIDSLISVQVKRLYSTK